MRKKEHVPDYVKKSASYQARAAAGKPKKINIWLGVFYIAMVCEILTRPILPVGKYLVGDILHILLQLAFFVSGWYVIWQIFRRNDKVYENETIKNLIYYKEHSRKWKKFLVSFTLLLVYTLTMVMMIVTYIIGFYGFYIMGK